MKAICLDNHRKLTSFLVRKWLDIIGLGSKLETNPHLNMAEDTQELTFEKALNQLEELVAAMENGATPLAELVDKYAEGDKLLKFCQKRLNEAELKIEQLRKGGDSPVFEEINLKPQE